MSQPDFIRLRGVRQNNLKGFDLDLPLGQYIAVTGLSGAGKSSLVFDTLHAEGQRRYVETFSAYTRQFLDLLDKPKVDAIENIRPSIAIAQTNTVKTSRSTVGTMTELTDFAKVWFSHVAECFDPETGEKVEDDNPQSIWRKTLAAHAGETLLVAFPVTKPANLEWAEVLGSLKGQGYVRVLAPAAPERAQVEDESLSLRKGRKKSAARAAGVAATGAAKVAPSARVSSRALAGHVHPDPVGAGSSVHGPQTSGQTGGSLRHLEHGPQKSGHPAPPGASYRSQIAAPGAALHKIEDLLAAGSSQISNLKSQIHVVQDRLRIGAENQARFLEATETAMHFGAGEVVLFAEAKGTTSPVEVGSLSLSSEPLEPERPRSGKPAEVGPSARVSSRALAARDLPAARKNASRGLPAFGGAGGDQGRVPPPQQSEPLAGARSHQQSGSSQISNLKSQIPGKPAPPGASYRAVGHFSRGLHSPRTGRTFRPATPALFSFNSPLGACPKCRGFGRVIDIDYRLAIPDHSLSIAQGAIRPWEGEVYGESKRDLVQFAKKVGLPVDVPFAALSAEQKAFVIEGSPGYDGETKHWPQYWYGLKGFFRYLEKTTYKMHVRVFLSRYRAYNPCPDCHGARLQPEALCWKWRGYTLPELYALPVSDLLRELSEVGQTGPSLHGSAAEVGHAGSNVHGSPTSTPTSGQTEGLPSHEASARHGSLRHPDPSQISNLKSQIVAASAESARSHSSDLALDSMITRLRYLEQVGLGYLTLDRSSRTLSGGEVERVNLTSCLGTSLVDTLFVLDEPSVGLHPRDIDRLIGIIRTLTDAGNTVVVVEHDEAMIRAADHVVEVGPEPGARGGEIVFQGTVDEMLASKASLTGAYFSGRETIPVPVARRPVAKAGQTGLSLHGSPTSSPKSGQTGGSLRHPEAVGPLEDSGLKVEDSRGQPALAARGASREQSTSHNPQSTSHNPPATAATPPQPTGNPQLGTGASLALRFTNASKHNIKNLSFDLPLGRFVCLSGVSGSGKSTLLDNVIYQGLMAQRGQMTEDPAEIEAIRAVRGSPQSPRVEDKSLSSSTLEPERPRSGNREQPAPAAVAKDETLALRAAPSDRSGPSQISNLKSQIPTAVGVGEIVLVDQSPLSRTPRSNAALYCEAWDLIRELYAATPAAQGAGFGSSSFSFNSGDGRCDHCQGLGSERVEMQFLSDVFVPCPICEGRRFKPEVLAIQWKGRSVADLLATSVEDAIRFFGEEGESPAEDSGSRIVDRRGGSEVGPSARVSSRALAGHAGSSVRGSPMSGQTGASLRHPAASQIANRCASIVARLRPLQAVGLGYLTLGQPLNTLSGGESQRLKLVRYLGSVAGGSETARVEEKSLSLRTAATETPAAAPADLKPKLPTSTRLVEQHERPAGALLLLDEPTTGLHRHDVKRLLEVLQRIVDQGHSVVVIEHNLDVLKSADWIIEIGPDAGAGGGRVVAAGTPEDVASSESATAPFLAQALGMAKEDSGLRVVDRRGAAEVAPSARVSSRALAGHAGSSVHGSPTSGQTGGLPSHEASARHGSLRHPDPSQISNLKSQILAPTTFSSLEVVGARENNLKNISVEIPHRQLSVVTGVSGSGKSTLAFDIIFAEGQRRFMESMSPYARQFVEQLPRPDIDRLTGIPPTVAIEQRVTRGSRKSTVATITEVAQYLRLLFARMGVQYHPETGRQVTPLSPAQLRQLLERTLATPAARKAKHLYLCAPLIRGRKGHHEPIANWIAKHGYPLMRADGRLVRPQDFVKLDRYKEHDIEVVIHDFKRAEGGKLKAEPKSAEAKPSHKETKVTKALASHAAAGARESNIENQKSKIPSTGNLQLGTALAEALRLGKGSCFLLTPKGEVLSWFSTTRTDLESGESFPELDPKQFSFNSPRGWCPTCRGHGRIYDWMLQRDDEDEEEMSDEVRDALRAFDPDEPVAHGRLCPTCHGERLNRIARAVRVPIAPRRESAPAVEGRSLSLREMEPERPRSGRAAKVGHAGPSVRGRQRSGQTEASLHHPADGRAAHGSGDPCHSISLPELLRLTAPELIATLRRLELDERGRLITQDIVPQIEERLRFLAHVGLEYLSLDRPTETLSGGEAQRIRLAAQLGSNLSGVLYVLDEPSIGLHARDNDRLTETLAALRDKGNTLLVVEHDEVMMERADRIIDLGPGAGVHGGEVLANATPAEIKQDAASLTGLFLAKGIPHPIRGAYRPVGPVGGTLSAERGTPESKAENSASRRHKTAAGTHKSHNVPSVPFGTLSPQPTGNHELGTAATNWLQLTDVTHRNLVGQDIALPLGRLVMVCGPSGAGKSTLFRDIVHPAVAAAIKAGKRKLSGKEFLRLVPDFQQDEVGHAGPSVHGSQRSGQTEGSLRHLEHGPQTSGQTEGSLRHPPSKLRRLGRKLKARLGGRSASQISNLKSQIPFAELTLGELFKGVIEVDQSPIGKTPRSTPATYLGIFDLIRQFFASLPEAKLRGYTASRFSFNVPGGRCEACAGAGRVKLEMAFMADSYLPCDACGGSRYSRELDDITWKGKTIGEVLRLSFDEAIGFFDFHSQLSQVCRLMADCGLGYLTLGQSSPTLSGGEAQRLKLVTELTRGLASYRERSRGIPVRNLYLLEEPTIGLHLSDCEKLIKVLHNLVDQGHTVVVIEHHLDLLAEGDWLIELGPEGGPAGGHVLYQGPLAGLRAMKDSPTGRYLAAMRAPRKPVLNR